MQNRREPQTGQTGTFWIGKSRVKTRCDESEAENSRHATTGRGTGAGTSPFQSRAEAGILECDLGGSPEYAP